MIIAWYISGKIFSNNNQCDHFIEVSPGNCFSCSSGTYDVTSYNQLSTTMQMVVANSYNLATMTSNWSHQKKMKKLSWNSLHEQQFHLQHEINVSKYIGSYFAARNKLRKVWWHEYEYESTDLTQYMFTVFTVKHESYKIEAFLL